MKFVLDLDGDGRPRNRVLSDICFGCGDDAVTHSAFEVKAPTDVSTLIGCLPFPLSLIAIAFQAQNRRISIPICGACREHLRSGYGWKRILLALLIIPFVIGILYLTLSEPIVAFGLGASIGVIGALIVVKTSPTGNADAKFGSHLFTVRKQKPTEMHLTIRNATAGDRIAHAIDPARKFDRPDDVPMP
jgi:hypothetical protein